MKRMMFTLAIMLLIGLMMFDCTADEDAPVEGIPDEVMDVPIDEHTAVVEEEFEEVDRYSTCDIPLDTELQKWIIEHCLERDINPYLVFAMCERESRYEEDAIGDNGKSLGIMQIQPRWHKERMARLGCTDLFDAKQNITVGVDYPHELCEMGKGVDWALMAYNGGNKYANNLHQQGKLSEYAEYILDRTYELECENIG